MRMFVKNNKDSEDPLIKDYSVDQLSVSNEQGLWCQGLQKLFFGERHPGFQALLYLVKEEVSGGIIDH